MKILVGYNANEGGSKGLLIALQQAQSLNAEVVLLTSLISSNSDTFVSDMVDDSKRKIAEAKKNFEAAGIACTTEIIDRGMQPGEDIVKYAKENQVDLIIVGVRIRSRVAKLLLGSTSQYTILKAHCPVLSYNYK